MKANEQVKGDLEIVREARRVAFEEAAKWCAAEASRVGAVDGYDYHSGQEYAYSRAAKYFRNTASALAEKEPS